MIKVILLGAGNLAVHLAKAFSDAKNIDFVQRYSRDGKNDAFFDKTIPKTNKISALQKADIYVVSVSDQAIASFSKQFTFTTGLVVHTSGSMALQTLQCEANKGVLYPLQTFSKTKNVNFKTIPIAIETEHKKDFALLMQFTKEISDLVYKIDSLQREKMHIAAVFANNFSNQMFKIAKDICDENNFPFDILKPLIQETAKKIETLNPKQAQTGPAKRNDLKLIETHLKALKGEQKQIYALLSKSIMKTTI